MPASLKQLRRNLLDTGELGGFAVCTTTTAVADTDPDARRKLVSADLVHDEAGETSYGGWYAYLSGGNAGSLLGQQRTVRTHGYGRAQGQVALNAELSAIPPLGTEFELLAKLPAVRWQGRPGLREIINQALERLWVADWLPFTGNGTATYAVTAYPWLTQERIFDVQESYGSTLPFASGMQVQLRQDAETPVLDIGRAYSPSEKFWLRVMRPAHTRIRAGGVWQESTAGLVNDTDETLAELNLVTTVALAYAYRALAKGPPPDTAYEGRAERQEAKAAAIRWYSAPRFQRAPVYSGPVVTRSGGRRWSGRWP